MAEHKADAERVFMEGLKPGDVALIRDVAELAAEKGVNAAFTRMGLDPTQPLKAQRDFNFLRDLTHDDEFHADMEWLRRARRQSEGIWGKVVTVAIGASVLGALHALWLGVQTIALKVGVR